MTTKTVTIGENGALIITKTDDIAPPVPPQPPGTVAAMTIAAPAGHHAGGLDGSSFIAGLALGALLYFIIQTYVRTQARRAARAERDRDGSRDKDEFTALARRTANLERIVTDPARRVDAEIDALR